MDAMNSLVSSPPFSSFTDLLKQLRRDFPATQFSPAASFYWSAETQTIHYNARDKHAIWSLFHEIGHMSHKHNTYNSDARLIQMEVEAWHSAMTIAQTYGYSIDEEHVQDCLDSYRRWQYTRSLCPVCTQVGIEKSNGAYGCINCRHEWRVSANRFCRVYRTNKKALGI